MLESDDSSSIDIKLLPETETPNGGELSSSENDNIVINSQEHELDDVEESEDVEDDVEEEEEDEDNDDDIPPSPQPNCSHSNKLSKIRVYTDPVVTKSNRIEQGRPIFKNNSSLSRLSTSSSVGRSPLSIVLNNNSNIPQQQTSPLNLKLDLATCDEKFFLYRKESYRSLNNENFFAKLSDEMILSIFKWLPKKTLIRCSSVSRQFHRVAQDDTLWTRLDLGGRTLNNCSINAIFKRGIVILRLAQTEMIDPIFNINNEYEFGIKLQYLDMSMAVISLPALTKVMRECRQLRKLSLEHVRLNYDICFEISENKDLEALNLTMCEGICVDGVRKLTEELKR